jgi:hypothetical protein
LAFNQEDKKRILRWTLDHEHGECLRCKLARNREAGAGEALPKPE